MGRGINCCGVALMHMMMHGNCESERIQCWAS